MNAFILLLVNLVVFILFIAPAWPQPPPHPGHAQGHDQYKSWVKPNTVQSCCNGEAKDVQGNVLSGDCRPTRAYVDEHGSWRAWTGSYWIIVPPASLLPTDFMGDGRSHLCERFGNVICFTPGPPRS